MRETPLALSTKANLKPWLAHSSHCAHLGGKVIANFAKFTHVQ